MSNELLDELRKGTDFQYVSGEDVAGFTDRPLVTTPIESLNCFLGGGIPVGAIVACSGGNAAGKSSAAYEILGNFQKEYPDGIAMILDSEASIDPLRLSQLGVDVSKVLILPAGTLEAGFEQINKILSKKAENKKLSKIPVIIIWDTISAAPTASQAEKGGAYAGGMAEAPRVIKNGLKQIYGLVSSQNVLLILINQITADLGGWKPTTGISGGNALKHAIHLHLEFKGGKTNYSGVFATTKQSSVTITKSKISPLISDLPLELDITKGGIIDRESSFVWWMSQFPEIMENSRGWYSFTDDVKLRYHRYFSGYPKWSSRFRYNELVDGARSDEDLLGLLKLMWLDMIRSTYVLQAQVVDPYYIKILEKLNSRFPEVPIETPVVTDDSETTDNINQEVLVDEN